MRLYKLFAKDGSHLPVAIPPNRQGPVRGSLQVGFPSWPGQRDARERVPPGLGGNGENERSGVPPAIGCVRHRERKPEEHGAVIGTALQSPLTSLGGQQGWCGDDESRLKEGCSCGVCTTPKQQASVVSQT